MSKSIKNILKSDYAKIYSRKPNLLKKIKLFLTNDYTLIRWKYIKCMRKADNLSYDSHIIDKVKKMYYQRGKNKYGLMLGYEIGSKNIGKGLCLYHNGPIVINNDSIIGENCSFHGDNCVGNNGVDSACPIIGNNVDIGVGAKIIGNVKIANNVTIGAGSIIVHDILKEGVTVVGVPGKIINKKSL